MKVIKHDYKNAIDLVTMYRDLYQSAYDNMDKKKKGAEEYKKNISALETTREILEYEKEYQDEQEAHAYATIEQERGVDIPLKEWAEKNDMHPATARQKAARGMFETAKKLGRDWWINEDEKNVDHRKKKVIL